MTILIFIRLKFVVSIFGSYQMHANEASFMGAYDLALDYYNRNFSSAYKLSDDEIADFKTFKPTNN